MRTLVYIRRFVKYFLQGLLYLTPIGITTYLIFQIYLFLANYFDQYFEYGSWYGIVAIIVIITLLGYLGRTIIAQPLISLFEQIIKRTPFVKFVYSSIKDVLGAFLGKDKKFKNPVLVQIYGSNVEKIGFVTQKDLSDLGIPGNKVAVYFPYAFTFMGDLCIVPAENITKLNIPTSDAMKFIVSGGVTKMDN
ncbi:MAG: DUF502 domain-containing protein [Bacteroidales bacterium]|nr:DUF502 domain-containing protein [Bacteroidales bacterium]